MRIERRTNYERNKTDNRRTARNQRTGDYSENVWMMDRWTHPRLVYPFGETDGRCQWKELDDEMLEIESEQFPNLKQGECKEYEITFREVGEK